VDSRGFFIAKARKAAFDHVDDRLGDLFGFASDDFAFLLTLADEFGQSAVKVVGTGKRDAGFVEVARFVEEDDDLGGGEVFAGAFRDLLRVAGEDAQTSDAAFFKRHEQGFADSAAADSLPFQDGALNAVKGGSGIAEMEPDNSGIIS
jgi:hypothetical protein